MIHCLIRKKPVAKTPEECVRQSVIQEMVTLGYPKSLIVLEKELEDLLPQDKKLNLKRRLDIVAYAKDSQGSLFPLLIIECKAKKLNQKALSQVLGYNLFLLAPFFAVISVGETAFFTKKDGEVVFIGNQILSFSALLQETLSVLN